MASTPGARQAPSPLLKRVLDRFCGEHGQPVPASPEALSLQLALRRLWADHVIWTREYVVAAIANSPDAQAVAGRLLANQEHIGSAIVPFYGEQASRALTGLLRQHIMVAVELIEAAKTGDQDKFADAGQRWDQNARHRVVPELREPELA